MQTAALNANSEASLVTDKKLSKKQLTVLRIISRRTGPQKPRSRSPETERSMGDRTKPRPQPSLPQLPPMKEI